MKIYLIAALTLLITYSSFNQINGYSTDIQSKAEVGVPAPYFILEDQDGNSVSLSNFKDKIVILEWLNPDCPFVQRHYKSNTMTSLASNYSDNGVVWLAINSTHTMNKDDDKKWVEKHSLQYPILDDSSGNVGKLYGAKTTPNMFIIDKSGTLIYAGAIDDDPDGSKGENKVNYVEKALKEVITGNPVSISETKPYGCSVKYSK
ncbi:MAG: thioredoxin family protein [Thermodesulfobacteriota bacterium]